MFPGSPKADAIYWGGGSSRIFPGSPIADVIQWGGGGSGRICFRVLQKPTRFSGGGTYQNVSAISGTRAHSGGGGGSNRNFQFAKSHFYPTLSDIPG